jgi:aspartate racemase
MATSWPTAPDVSDADRRAGAAPTADPPRRTVGVMGGLGPAATLDFFAKVLRATEAARDQDHIRLLIDNNPAVPNRNEAAAGRGPSPGPALAAMARGLEAAGADFLVMVCNAAHGWEGEIRAAVRLPFVSLIAETVAAARALRPGLTRVGVLASSGCHDAGLYEAAFAAEGVEVLTPERAAFMALLDGIKAGEVGEGVRRAMRDLAQGLADGGAELIIAGCTEVPLVLADGEISAPLVSSTDVLVARTIAYARGAPLPS